MRNKLTFSIAELKLGSIIPYLGIALYKHVHTHEKRHSATNFKTGHTATTPQQPSPAPRAHPSATPSRLSALQPLPPLAAPRSDRGCPSGCGANNRRAQSRAGQAPAAPRGNAAAPRCRPVPGRTTAVRSCTLLGSGSAMLGSGRLGGRSAPQRHHSGTASGTRPAASSAGASRGKRRARGAVGSVVRAA